MNSSSAKITYLVHSGFSVETAEHFLLFDYCPSLVREPSITDEFLKTKRNVYVFISHSHSDHFDPAVLQWARINPKINYIISSDVPIKNTFRQAHILSAYEAWEEPTLKVKAFGSTDAGISFLVQTDGLSVFHAGDLNWWNWKGETAEEQAYAEKNFKAEIAKLSGQKIDIAFFPVDRQIGRVLFDRRRIFCRQTASPPADSYAFRQGFCCDEGVCGQGGENSGDNGGDNA